MTHFTHYFIVCEFGSNVFNQVHTWFTKLLPESVCVCMYACMHACFCEESHFAQFSTWKRHLPSSQSLPVYLCVCV